MLSAFKALNKYTLFDEWSKDSPKYDKHKNDQIWLNNACEVDINYIIIVLKKAGNNFKFIEKYQIFRPLTHNIDNIKKVDVNHKYLFDENNYDTTFNYELFDKHNTIIIKSCTGTGKTTAIAKHVSRCMTENKKNEIIDNYK